MILGGPRVITASVWPAGDRPPLVAHWLPMPDAAPIANDTRRTLCARAVEAALLAPRRARLCSMEIFRNLWTKFNLAGQLLSFVGDKNFI